MSEEHKTQQIVDDVKDKVHDVKEHVHEVVDKVADAAPNVSTADLKPTTSDVLAGVKKVDRTILRINKYVPTPDETIVQALQS